VRLILAAIYRAHKGMLSEFISFLSLPLLEPHPGLGRRTSSK
jgi:hypothetical protein